MRILGHLVTKELLLLARDWHALALLFVMPVAFILVMSLALQDQFATQSDVSIHYVLINQDAGADAATINRDLADLTGFERLHASNDPAAAKRRVRRGEAQFLVILPDGLTSLPDRTVRVYAAPDVGAAVYQLFKAGVQRILDRHTMTRLADNSLGGESDLAHRPTIDMQTLYAPGARRRIPSAVQQNVPAWLLFAMFFIAVPLSTTWLQERRQGTHARLRSMGLSAPMLLCGKLLPYLGLNMAQVVAMLAVGVFLVPLLGGEALTLGQSPVALVLVALAAGFAAVGYALLVANLVSTSEQATLFTGVANLLMAAVGGIMVPRFIMPHALQVLSHYSPMTWGLDGFLTVFLRGGGPADVMPTVFMLIAFGITCLLIAAATMHFRHDSA